MTDTYRTLDPRTARKLERRAGKFKPKHRKSERKRFRDEAPPTFNPRDFTGYERE